MLSDRAQKSVTTHRRVRRKTHRSHILLAVNDALLSMGARFAFRALTWHEDDAVLPPGAPRVDDAVCLICATCMM